MPNTAIKVQNVSKIYKLYDKPIDRLKESLSLSKKQYHKEFYALNDVSFEIKKGETVGIIGKNGAGKSTLLKIITGVLTPTSGHVHVNGKISSLLELGTGFNPEMTGYENIYLYGSIMGFTKDEMDTKLESILSFADIGEFVYQPVKTYSSGMFARLAFATAINIDPDILIVDEVLSVGDAAFAKKCYDKMRDFIDNGATVLLVSHSEQSILQNCSRTLLFHGGHIIADGASKKILSLYIKSIYGDADLDEIMEDKILGNSGDSKSILAESNISNSVDDTSFYDSQLISDSKLVYRSSQEIELLDYGIFNSLGQKVNCLKFGKQYSFNYKIKFNTLASNVRFGMMIKSSHGLEICGATRPFSLESIMLVEQDYIVEVNWKFVNKLVSGHYFVNAGILGEAGEIKGFINRFVDLLMFKVLPSEELYDRAGFVDLDLQQTLNIYKA